MAKLIKVNGDERIIKPKGNKFTLEELQELIGGYIEILPTAYNVKVVCDEEGRLKEKLINKKASALVCVIIVGDVVVVDEEELD